ncbi:MAG TPA: dTMP kinase [bacterium]|nr:dTMP kinase [bacterium]
MSRGMFVTFEGIEGCGKTTQAARLKAVLEKRGHSVVLTREPGGTTIGSKLRDLLLDPNTRKLAPLAELLLYEADRAQHVAETIRPALEAGKIVLCDRFGDASAAYQGAARGLGVALVEQLNAIATGGLSPDLTLLLDLPAKLSVSRARERAEKAGGKPDRFEREDFTFHEAVRKGYLEIAAREKSRYVVIDAGRGVEEIEKDILAAVGARIPET